MVELEEEPTGRRSAPRRAAPPRAAAAVEAHEGLLKGAGRRDQGESAARARSGVGRPTTGAEAGACFVYDRGARHRCQIALERQERDPRCRGCSCLAWLGCQAKLAANESYGGSRLPKVANQTRGMAHRTRPSVAEPVNPRCTGLTSPASVLQGTVSSS